MKFTTQIAALALFGALAANAASAQVITFDGLAGVPVSEMVGYSPGYYTYFYGTPAAIDGYNFSAVDSTHSFTIGSGYTGGDANPNAWNGTDYFIGYSYNGGGGVAASQIGGAAFSVNSLDIADFYDYSNYTATITGNFIGGGSISQIIGLNTCNSCTLLNNDFTHVSLSGFNNLSSLVITGNGSSYYNYLAIDNLTLNAAPVPEPETYAMMLAGLGLLGFRLRRKNKTSFPMNMA